MKYMSEDKYLRMLEKLVDSCIEVNEKLMLCFKSMSKNIELQLDKVYLILKLKEGEQG